MWTECWTELACGVRDSVQAIPAARCPRVGPQGEGGLLSRCLPKSYAVGPRQRLAAPEPGQPAANGPRIDGEQDTDEHFGTSLLYR